MKFQCTVQNIHKAFSYAQLVISKRGSLPLLESTLLIIKGNLGVIRVTNLSIGLEISFPVKSEQDGTVALSGGLISEVLGTLNSEDIVTFRVEDSLLYITTSGSESTVKTIPHEEFPILPRIEKGAPFKTKSNDFLQAIKYVSYAASTSDIKPEISSLYLYSDDEGVVLVSTDSFRLAEKKLLVPNIPKLPGSMIPIKNIKVLSRVLSEYEEDLEVVVGETQIVFKTKSLYFVSQLVDGRYPDYQQIIPKETTTELVVLKQDLTNTLRTLNVFADKFHQVDLTIDPTKKTCLMVSQNSEVGQNITELPCAIKGQEINMRFNARYIQDCLPSISSDSVRLGFVAPNKPILVSGVGLHDFVYLVMPMNR